MSIKTIQSAQGRKATIKALKALSVGGRVYRLSTHILNGRRHKHCYVPPYANTDFGVVKGQCFMTVKDGRVVRLRGAHYSGFRGVCHFSVCMGVQL
jgi:hypothetical protein